MMSAQEQEEWYRQELRYRREESQISFRWFWSLLFAFQMFLLCSGMLRGTFWHFVVLGLVAVSSAVLSIRAWGLWSQHRRVRRIATDDQTEPPAA